jgi:hypothetical protein
MVATLPFPDVCTLRHFLKKGGQKKSKRLAIYHFSHRKNKRSSGANVINKVAYRLRTKAQFVDFNTGELKTRYHRSKNPDEQIIDLGVYGAPQHLKDPLAWAKAIESSENRKNSVVCREFEVALPKELTKLEMREAVEDLIEETITKHGMTAHAVIHYSEENPHVHILFSEKIFNEKKNKFGNKSRVYTSLGSDVLQHARETWANVANKYLTPYGVEITHKSFEDRNIYEVLPTKHVGTQMRPEKEFDSIVEHNKEQTEKRENLIKKSPSFREKYYNVGKQLFDGIENKIKKIKKSVKMGWRNKNDEKIDDFWDRGSSGSTKPP